MTEVWPDSARRSARRPSYFEGALSMSENSPGTAVFGTSRGTRAAPKKKGRGRILERGADKKKTRHKTSTNAAAVRARGLEYLWPVSIDRGEALAVKP